MSKTYSAGIVTAYGAAKRAGYQGTYEDFCRQQAGYAENAAAVEQAKNTAVNAATTATTKAGEATTAATAAQTAKTQTEAAASQALTDISTARSGAISAVQTEGATQTANATAQAQAAATSAIAASTKASEASASATSAGQSATNAAASATSAANAASAAQGVLESIPQDYSDLSSDVDDLKADLGALESIAASAKNLFNKNRVESINAYISGTSLVSNANAKTVYIPCEPNTTYTVSKTSVTKRFAVAYSDVLPTVGGTVAGTIVRNNNTSITITTGDNAQYLAVWVYLSTADTMTFEQICDMLQIEVGNNATSYEPYKMYAVDEIVREELDGLKSNIQTIVLDGLSNGKKNYPIKYNEGFIGSNGIINNPTSSQEVFTNNLEVNEGDEIYVSLQYDTDRAMWLAYATYDENETFENRIQLINETKSSYSGKITISSGVKYVSFSFRTYGVATFDAYAQAPFYVDLNGKINVLDEKVDEISPLRLSNTVKTIAHRGDDIDAPQCVAAAYIYARKRGHTIAENDVWNSEDGQLLMWHDTDLSRLGNLVDINGYAMYTDGTDYYWVDLNNNVYTYDFSISDYVSSTVSLESLTRCAGSAYGVNSDFGVIGLNLDVLKRIDFGVYKGSKFKGEQILTFAEWVLLCKQLGMEIYIDRKIQYTQAVVTELVNTVKSYGMLDKTSWINVGTSAIDLIRAIDPDARCGILTHPTESLIATYEPYNIGRGFFFNGNAEEMTREAIQLGLNAGFEVEVWYVGFANTPEETVFQILRNAVSYGCTGITTDKYRIDEAFEGLLTKYDD